MQLISMTLLDHRHFQNFFSNKDINELYGSMAIFSLGISLIMLYVPIFVYERGFSIAQILMFFVLAAFFFLLFSIPSAKICSRFGSKHTMLASIPFLIAFFLGLNYLYPGSVLYFILPALASAHSSLFNIGYHLNFIDHADRDKTARQLTLVNIFSSLVHFIGPFFGALIIANYGFGITFFIGSLILFLSMIPLFLSEDQHDPLNFSIKDIFAYLVSRQHTPMNLSFLGYAVESIINRLIWPIFLIGVLKTITMVGGIVALTGLFTLFAMYFIARIADKWDKRKLIKIGTYSYALGWLFRLFVYSPFSIFSVDTYKNISMNTIHIPWSAYFYDIARKKNYFEFIVAREIVFNISRVVILPILVLLLKLSGLGFYLAFVIAAAFSLLYMFIKE